MSFVILFVVRHHQLLQQHPHHFPTHVRLTDDISRLPSQTHPSSLRFVEIILCDVDNLKNTN